jgi:hypothetical protein
VFSTVWCAPTKLPRPTALQLKFSPVHGAAVSSEDRLEVGSFRERLSSAIDVIPT